MRERLYRSRTDRVLFGVAGGMADWLDVDPAVVRLVWALLVIAAGTGILLYLIAALVIPEEPLELAAQPGVATQPDGTAPTAGTAGGAATGDPAATSWHDARQARRAARHAAHGHRDGSLAVVFGVILVLVGGWFLVRRLLPNFDESLFWPVVLIAVGLLLLAGAMRRGPGAPPS